MSQEAQMKPLTAAELIASRRRRYPTVELSPEALQQLRELCEANDALGRNRLGRREALRLLESHGFPMGEDMLNRVCREQLGRTSYVER